MNENETNIISKMSIKVIGGGVYLKNKPQTITITWEIKDENGNIITPDTLSVNNIPLDPTTTSKTYHRVFSDVDFTVRAVKDGVLAIGTTTARFVGPTQTVEDSLTSNSRSIAASANSVRLLNEKIENNSSFKGLFTSLDDLKKKLRSGNNGDWAIVGEGIPAPIYIWNKNGWEATGGQYTGSTIDLDSYYTKEDVADYTDDYNVSKNHSHIVKIYDLVNWKVVERKPDAPVFQLGQSYDAGEVVNMTDDNDSSYECLQATITAPYLNQEVRSFTLAEAISFLPEDLCVTGQKISFLSSELNAWMTYVFTGGDYTNPTYWEIFTNNIDPDTNQKIADLQAKDEDLQNQINEDVTNLNNHIAESDAKFEEIDNTLTKHEDRMDDIEDEILLSSVEATCAPKDVEILADRAYKDHLGNIIADEYITRDTLTEEIIDITNQQVTDLKPGSVQPEDLSEAVKQMIGCKKITNLPDEEDITVTKDNTLKFKDREYSPKDYSGMGKKILRKHYINGINTLTQHMINKPNTIYVIRYDYCLQEQTIEIPENCVLEFDGGSLRNGTVKGNNTIINAGIVEILDTEISGTFCIDQAYPEWFGAKGDGTNDDSNSINKAIGLHPKKVVFLNKIYAIESRIELNKHIELSLGRDCIIKATSNIDYIIYVNQFWEENIQTGKFLTSIHGGKLDCNYKADRGIGNHFGINTRIYDLEISFPKVSCIECGKDTLVGSIWVSDVHLITNYYNDYPDAVGIEANRSDSAFYRVSIHDFIRSVVISAGGCKFTEVHCTMFGDKNWKDTVAFTMETASAAHFNMCDADTMRTFMHLKRNYVVATIDNCTHFKADEEVSDEVALEYPPISFKKDEGCENSVLCIIGGYYWFNVPYTLIVPFLNDIVLVSRYNLNLCENPTSISYKTQTYSYIDSKRRTISMGVQNDLPVFSLDKGETWSDSFGFTANKRSGADFPDNLKQSDIGFSYYYTTGNGRGIPVWWNGNKFVNNLNLTPNFYRYSNIEDLPKVDNNDYGTQIYLTGERNNRGFYVFNGTVWLDGAGQPLSNHKGDTASRINNAYHTKPGYVYINTETNRVEFFSGENTENTWINADGELYDTLRIGDTSHRPIPINPNFQYFDTTLNKPIWWTGSKWVDATGADV